ncbi:MAG: response regulator [Candidatus Pristimantibacillus sp.]
MPRMMIVDDEETIRLGLTQLVQRLLPEWEIVLSCEDAESALVAVEERAPELAIIDINMPGMSGLELSRLLEKNRPEMYKIILTGYEKFDYAQTAIRNGATDYLLKPVQRDELVHAVRKVEQLLREKELQSAVHVEKLLLEWLVSQSDNRFSELRQAFVSRGWLNEQQDGVLEYSVITMFWDYGNSGIDRLHMDLVAGHLERAAPGVQQVIGVVVSESCTLFVVIGTGMPGHTEWEAMLLRLNLGRNSAYHTGPRLNSLGCSSPFTRLEQLHEGYKYALKRVFHREGEEIQEHGKEDRERLKKLTVAIETNDVQATLELLQQWKREVARLSGESIFYIASRCYQFLSVLSGAALLSNHSRLGSQLKQESEQLAERLPLALTAAEMVRAVEAFVDGLALGDSDERNIRKVIERVQEMIKQQFSNHELNLELLAQSVFLHPTYLSELFKESTGQKFIDYLTMVRLEEARRILRESDMKMYEVAFAVGYTSPKYFSTLFRKVYHMTPMMYRERAH